jgi:retron-type reverse transcriptase
VSDTLKDIFDKNNYKITVTNNKSFYYKKKKYVPPIFYTHNYGFRPNKSAHHALKCIKHWRFNTSFLIEYDVCKTFNNLNRKRLKNLFTNRIKDSRFWREISEFWDY